MKMLKKHENRLRCLCGACEHPVFSTTCPYAKILEAKSPEEAQVKEIKKLIDEVVQYNLKSKK